VEGAFARVARTGLQPVEIGRRLAREMDLQRTIGVSAIVGAICRFRESSSL
jgi:hypothetical protein